MGKHAMICFCVPASKRFPQGPYGCIFDFETVDGAVDVLSF
jgi:hypothetical protein